MSPFFAKIAVILCLGLFGCVLLLIFHKIQSTDEKPVDRNPQYPGYVRQHGDYWVWNYFITANEDFVGNESITLTTHGSYMDLGLLPEVVSRWQAPISLTIFACGKDFGRFMNSLNYINSCLKMGDLMRRYVSIHLVMHQQFIPQFSERGGLHFTHSENACQKPAPYANGSQKHTYWYSQKLRYPLNLLRNVARLNVRTYYVLALDLELLPPPKFPQKFLKFAWNHDSWRYADIREPYTTVFCLPTFAHRPEAPFAITKFQLLMVLRDFNITSPIYDDLRMQMKWLHALNPKEELFIFSRSRKMEMCVGYISINELEPLYDENNEMESIYAQGKNLKAQVMIDLNFTFIVLDGAFLLRRTIDSWKPFRPNPRSGLAQINWQMWLTWHQFYYQLMSLVPEDFAQSWFLRSRTSQYIQTIMKNTDNEQSY